MTLTIQLLGGYRIATETGTSVEMPQPRLQLLLAYLLLHANNNQLRSHLAFLFWPDSTEKQARTNLRKLLYALRGIVPEAESYLHLTAGTVRWHTGPDCVVDVRAFEAGLAAAEATAGGREEERARAQATALTAALSHYGGPLLPGHYEDWVLVARERLHLRYMGALETLTTLYVALDEPAAALEAGQRLIQADPLQESAYRRVMELRLALGEPAGALRVYHTCARVLEEELGVEPSPETQKLYLRILRADEQGGAPAESARRAPGDNLREMIPLAGRREEWGRVRQAWQAAQTTGPRLVVIQGEAGIGKTRLAEELVETVRRQGYSVLQARAYAAEGQAAYGPVADLLQSDANLRAMRGLAALWQTELARIVPELAHAAEHLVPAPMTEAWQQRRFHEALVQGCLVQGEPVLVHLDDLQWFERETLGWLHFLLRYDRRAKLLVVGTLRSDEVEANHGYHELRHTLLREEMLEEIALAPLGEAEVTQLAGAVMGEAPGAEATATLYRATEGNPLFVLETVRAMGGALPAGKPGNGVPELRMTPKVQAVIQARLARLSDAARRILRVAAVLGRHFTFDVLQAVAGQAVSMEELVQVLDELWQRRIIREHGRNGYDFSHDRIRETVYGEISPVLRPHLHGQVAGVLETLHKNALDPVSSRIAAHYAAAGRAAEALAYYRRAARYAVERYAHQEALQHLQRALELTPAHDRMAQYELRLACEQSYLAWGAPPERYENLQAMQALALELEACADSASDAPAGVHAGLARRAQVAVCLSSYYATSGLPALTRSTAQEAIELAEAARDPVLLAHAVASLGFGYHWYVGELEDARRELTRAAELAHSLGMAELEAFCLENIAATGMYSGMQADQLLDYLQRAFAIHEARGNLAGQSSLMNKFGYILFAQGEADYSTAVARYMRALELSRRSGQMEIVPLVAGNLGILHVAMGDYTEAERWLAESLRQNQARGQRWRKGVALGFYGELRASQGRFDEAITYNDEALEIQMAMGGDHRRTETLSHRGYIEYLRGDYDQALAHLEETVSLARTRADTRFEATALVRLGHVYLGRGQLEQARDAYAESYALRRLLRQYRRSLEALAGLAQVADAQEQVDEARRLTAQLYDQLQETQLDHSEEAFQVYTACYRLLRGWEDPRAAEIFALARTQLDERCATLANDPQRQTFRNTPQHRPFFTV